MKQISLAIGLIAIFILIQSQTIEVFAQETPQFFASTMHTTDNCPVTRLYASRMYVPVMIKEFHDPTPNWQVSSISMTNSTKSVANLDGTNKYSFLISTNDTDQFDFRTVASYTDGQEHQIWVEYWSQNQQVEVEQFSTLHGYLCRDFMVDTAVAPLQPDIGKAIQEAQAGTFQQLVNVILEILNQTQGLMVIVPVAVGIMIVILVIFLLYHRSGEASVKELIKKIKFIAGEQQKNIREQRMVTQHLVISEGRRNDNQKKSDECVKHAIKSMNDSLRSWSDQFAIDFRSILLETKLFKESEIDTAIHPPKIIPIEEEQKPVEIKPEELKEIEKIIEEEPIPIKETKKQSIFAFWKKDKTENEILGEDEWIAFYRAKNLTREQLLTIYKKKEPYVQKNYQTDENAYNQFNALFILIAEFDNK